MSLGVPVSEFLLTRTNRQTDEHHEHYSAPFWYLTGKCSKVIQKSLLDNKLLRTLSSYTRAAPLPITVRLIHKIHTTAASGCYDSVVYYHILTTC